MLQTENNTCSTASLFNNQTVKESEKSPVQAKGISCKLIVLFNQYLSGQLLYNAPSATRVAFNQNKATENHV